jgi:hypothetical protein
LSDVIADPAVKERMQQTGFDVFWNPMSNWPEAIRAEIVEARKIAAQANIKVD